MDNMNMDPMGEEKKEEVVGQGQVAEGGDAMPAEDNEDKTEEETPPADGMAMPAKDGDTAEQPKVEEGHVEGM